MISGSSMKLMMRNGAPHLGQASGSAPQTLRIKRAQARSGWWNRGGSDRAHGCSLVLSSHFT